MKSKLPHQITEEELLNIIEKQEEHISDQSVLIHYPTLGDDVIAFLTFYKLEPGEDLVSQRMLLDLYELWSRDPVSKTKLQLDLSKYLISTHKYGKVYYYLNRTTMNLTEEAFKLINQHSRDRSKSSPWRKHFENFLNKYEIKSGDFYLESFVLYDLYDEYVYSLKKKQPLGQLQFFNFCKIYFENQRVTHNKGICFGVDKSITKFLTQERMASLRKHHDEKTYKKRQRKVSRPKTPTES